MGNLNWPQCCFIWIQFSNKTCTRFHIYAPCSILHRCQTPNWVESQIGRDLSSSETCLKPWLPKQFKMCSSDFKIICLILHAILHLRFDFSYFQDIENRSQKVNTPKAPTIKLPLRNPRDICSSIRLKHKNSTGTACIPAPISPISSSWINSKF